MRTTFLIILLLSVFIVAHSQQSHSEMQMSAAMDKPATLISGMGSLHHPVATTNPEAQKFFDQGLSFVYAFNHDEAVRSFKRAADQIARSANYKLPIPTPHPPAPFSYTRC